MADCCADHFIGFCLEDGTPIMLVINDNVQTGWIDILTGVFTFGSPPVGTVRCDTSDIRPLSCDTDSITICGESAGATVTRVNASITAVTLAAPNSSRKAMVLWNDSTATVNIRFGPSASMTVFTWRIGPQSGYELPLPIFIGEVSGIWDAANGAMLITEET